MPRTTPARSPPPLASPTMENHRSPAHPLLENGRSPAHALGARRLSSPPLCRTAVLQPTPFGFGRTGGKAESGCRSQWVVEGGREDQGRPTTRGQPLPRARSGGSGPLRRRPWATLGVAPRPRDPVDPFPAGPSASASRPWPSARGEVDRLQPKPIYLSPGRGPRLGGRSRWARGERIHWVPGPGRNPQRRKARAAGSRGGSGDRPRPGLDTSRGLV